MYVIRLSNNTNAGDRKYTITGEVTLRSFMNRAWKNHFLRNLIKYKWSKKIYKYSYYIYVSSSAACVSSCVVLLWKLVHLFHFGFFPCRCRPCEVFFHINTLIFKTINNFGAIPTFIACFKKNKTVKTCIWWRKFTIQHFKQDSPFLNLAISERTQSANSLTHLKLLYFGNH